MKIAICDDDSLVLQELSELLNQYRAQNHSQLEYDLYSCPLELVSQFEKGTHYDIVLLDVFMPGINGIQCAKDIRTMDNFVKIIFLTSSPLCTECPPMWRQEERKASSLVLELTNSQRLRLQIFQPE